MTDVARAGPVFEDCELFVPYWTCLRCDSLQSKYFEGPERPNECSQCGYHQFMPKYHIHVSK